ncbi:hypothetical protein [Vibrio quintilis]|uniref:Uncharacterized protein n=1 Tax=Vibrio quintilis TaxID=1117707 RepID=A0A1M7YS85_9VIBR|nr:hypothetical protein [Vibrio quintilis]SHO55484.1 hypothetical protein VQ7734_01215 [Vibrio quintilis]
MKNNYLPVINAQIQCINELASGTKQERLSLVYNKSNYCIEKACQPPDARHSTILFQGKGRACHLFLNGYLASFQSK